MCTANTAETLRTQCLEQTFDLELNEKGREGRDSKAERDTIAEANGDRGVCYTMRLEGVGVGDKLNVTGQLTESGYSKGLWLLLCMGNSVN